MEKGKILEKYQIILERIASSSNSVGRNADDVKLVVVTKGHTIEKVEQSFEAGIRVFGENYVQEALPKISNLGERRNIEWHMIGHVQSRKARAVSEAFSYVQSLDSLKLARRLDRFAGESQRVIPVLLEFNVSGEGSKFGFPAWHRKMWDELLPAIEEIIQLEHIEVKGLMTMPPIMLEQERVRPYFRKLKEIQSYLREQIPQIEWNELSMGMSADFETAIQEGATIVRIGTAIMGPRV